MIDIDTFVSVDVETAGPNPSTYSLLSIGACLVSKPRQRFYVELKPINDNAIAEALAVTGLSLKQLSESGLSPTQAMASFEAWLRKVIPAGEQPTFLAFNAPFDWMFVNDYFHRYLGRNPFGHTAVDMRAYFMGLSGLDWHQTKMRLIAQRFASPIRLKHHAGRDAQDQARLFLAMLREAQAESSHTDNHNVS